MCTARPLMTCQCDREIHCVRQDHSWPVNVLEGSTVYVRTTDDMSTCYMSRLCTLWPPVSFFGFLFWRKWIADVEFLLQGINAKNHIKPYLLIHFLIQTMRTNGIITLHAIPQSRHEGCTLDEEFRNIRERNFLFQFRIQFHSNSICTPPCPFYLPRRKSFSPVHIIVLAMSVLCYPDLRLSILPSLGVPPCRASSSNQWFSYLDTKSPFLCFVWEGLPISAQFSIIRYSSTNGIYVNCC